METQIVICNVYKLFRDGSDFTKDSKKIVRTDIAMIRSYVNEKNSDWKNNGLWHEIDEEKTKEYYINGEERLKEERNQIKVESQLKDILVDVIKTGKNQNSSEIEELRAEYKNKFGKKPHHLWGINKLKEKLQ